MEETTPISTSSQNNKRIAKNTLFLYLRMFITMGVSLYTSRVVLNVLGIEDYGIYNIVGGVVVLFSFINAALSSATQRFLNFELGRSDIQTTKQVFSMSLTIHVCAAVVVVLLGETIGLWFLNTQISIPHDRISAANWVYQFSILTVCVSFIGVPYSSSVVAYEKMSFFAYIAIVEVTLKLLIVFLLVYIGFDKLKLYAVLTFFVAIVIFFCYKYYCNKKIEISRYKFFWDKTLFVKLLSFSGWMLFGATAGVSSTQGVNILLNIFYGVTVNSAMGIANQVNAAVNQFVSNFQTAFVPQITKLYSMGNLTELRQLIYRSSRFSFFLLFALACPLMLNMDFILKLWLKTVPEYSTSFCTLTLIYSLIEAMSKPVGYTMHATGQVKNYNIIMSIALMMNIVFSYIFLKLGFQPTVVLVISILVTVLCFVIRLLFVRHFKVLRVRDFFKNVVLRAFFIALLTLPLPLYIRGYYSQWESLFITSLFFFTILTITIYFIGFTKSEKEKIVKFAKSKILMLRK